MGLVLLALLLDHGRLLVDRALLLGTRALLLRDRLVILLCLVDEQRGQLVVLH